MSMTITHAGSLDHPITLIQKDSVVHNGVQKDVWDPPAEALQVTAGKRDRHGDESQEDGQKVATNQVSWRIWYNGSVNAADWRVRDDITGKVYDILSVIEIGSRQMQELKTEVSDNE